MENFDIKNVTKNEIGEYNYLLRDGADKFLSDFCKDKNFANVLEIGTAVGYSAFLILSNCDCYLTTIEKDQNKVILAKQNLDAKGMSGRYSILCGDAAEILPSLTNRYDMIFLDGPKGQYTKYLPVLLKLLNVGGYLIADNVYFQGKVLAQGNVAHKHRTIVNNLRKFLQQIQTDNDLFTQIFEIGDGISVSKKLK